jgi:uncharacterized protein
MDYRLKGCEVFMPENKSWPRLMMLGLMPLAAVASGLLVFHNMYLTFSLYYVVVCIIVPVFHMMKAKESFSETLATGISGLKQAIITGAFAGIVFFAVIWLFFRFAGNLFLSPAHVTAYLESIGYKPQMFLRLLIIFVLFNSVIEEIFWRGFIYTHFRRDFGAAPSALWVSFFFIQYHFLTVWLILSPLAAFVFTPILFAVSFFWCTLREKQGNVYAAVISHLAADLALILVLSGYYKGLQA